jgi:hypothetical protein
MPIFEKLSEEEVQKLRRRRSPTLDLSEYLAFLDTLGPGDWGAVTLKEGETQRAVKRRLTMAAKQKGWQLRYRRSPDGRIVFEVREAKQEG